MSLTFAVLKPVNRKAIDTFSDVVKVVRDDPRHSRFLAIEDLGIASSAPHAPPGVDWNDTVAELSLEEEKLPEFPPIGWRIGKVSDGGGRPNAADICIALPDAKDVAPNHCRLYLHPQSGLLVLKASADTNRSLYYLTEARKAVIMEPKQVLPLVRPSTSIIIAGAEYQISYTMTSENARSFFGPLSEFLLRWRLGSLHPAGQRYPSMTSSYTRHYDNYISHGHLGDGTFGHVLYGINKCTGDPVAIKEVRVRASREREALLREIDIVEMVQDSPLFLHLLDSWCSKHKSVPKDCPGHDFEHFYLVFELGLFDFRHSEFVHLPEDDAVELFHQILRGISVLHKHGIMHRDVTRNNMMVVSRSPLRAVLIDFGKAVVGDSSKQTTIGPAATLAPEVWGTEYGHEIDLWAWAYAASQWLGYREQPEQRNERISEGRLREVQACLSGIEDQFRGSKPRLSSFAGLLKSILVWERQERTSTCQALDHEVWTKFEGTAGPDGGPESKKARLETDSVQSTVPFSDEV